MWFYYIFPKKCWAKIAQARVNCESVGDYFQLRINTHLQHVD